MKNLRKIISLLLCAALLAAFAAFPAGAQRNEFSAQNAYSLTAAFNYRSLFEAFFRQIGQNIGAAARRAQTEREQTAENKETEEQKEEPVLSRIEEIERETARLVNEERAKYGLAALTYSEKLAAGAREKSEDMQRLRYFSHTSPTYGSPFDQMKKRGITYRAAGENIAMGYRSARAVVDAWMASPGHRANILSEKYTEIGIGYMENGNYWTQWFRG